MRAICIYDRNKCEQKEISKRKKKKKRRKKIKRPFKPLKSEITSCRSFIHTNECSVKQYKQIQKFFERMSGIWDDHDRV